MKFNPQTATELIRKHNLSLGTFRSWKFRGRIPDKYLEDIPRVTLDQVLSKKRIETAIRNNPGIEDLICKRKFKAGQKKGYYTLCLFSLIKEIRKA